MMFPLKKTSCVGFPITRRGDQGSAGEEEGNLLPTRSIPFAVRNLENRAGVLSLTRSFETRLNVISCTIEKFYYCVATKQG